MEYLKKIEVVKKLLASSQPLGHERELSPLALAYVGDAIFELMIRSFVVAEGNAPVNKLHKKAKAFVNAKAQAQMAFRMMEFFTEDEMAVFRRGRNAKSFTVPKNADIMEYRHATGLEAVFGYLYLSGNLERALELLQVGLIQEINV
jgi:ribonuclease-3 family protein